MKTWVAGGFTVSRLSTILGSNFFSFLSPTSQGDHDICINTECRHELLTNGVSEWGHNHVMHADMTGDMIACQLALNHFLVLFDLKNSK